MQDDVTFTASSSTTFAAQRVVFAAVMADACMIDRVIQADVHGTPLAAFVAPRGASQAHWRARRDQGRDTGSGARESSDLPYERASSGPVWV